ncbi:alpha-xenorhabdolysin family binary toxin subunit A [Pseudomonas sp. 3A(2025)]
MMSAVEPLKTDGEVHGADEVSQVGKDLMNVLSGLGDGVERDPGLLITNEDVRRIHRYVRTGLELPTDLEQIRQLVGDYGIDIAGLEPDAIQALYQAIHDHAASWSALENDMRAVGSDLYVFSGGLINTVDVMIELIKSLAAWQTLKPDDLTPEQIESLPPIELPDGDRQQLPGLVALVGDIEKLVSRHSVSTTRVSSGVAVFKGRLRDNLAPDVARKINLAKSSETNEAILRLNEDIARLNERIEQKIAEYEEYANYKWVGFWWGPIGGAISWSIYGPKANDALKEKDRLMGEKQGLERQLRQLNQFVSELHAFETNMQDLKARMDGATSSVSNIESLWVLLAELVESSRKSLEDLDDGKFLVIFVSRFKSLVSNWTDIKKHSLDLLTAFNNALEDTAR